MTLKTKFITFEEIPDKKEAYRLIIFFSDGEVFGSDDWFISSREILEMYDYSEDVYSKINEKYIEHIMLVYKEGED